MNKIRSVSLVFTRFLTNCLSGCAVFINVMFYSLFSQIPLIPTLARSLFLSDLHIILLLKPSRLLSRLQLRVCIRHDNNCLFITSLLCARSKIGFSVDVLFAPIKKSICKYMFRSAMSSLNLYHKLQLIFIATCTHSVIRFDLPILETLIE